MKFDIYPKQITNFLKNNNQYIPKRMDKNEHLKLYKRYWLLDSEIQFKVQRVYQVFNREYYTVRYPESLYGEISYPINESFYELSIYKGHILNIDNIVNCKKSFTGSEIKFWFYRNKDNLDEYKFRKFFPFVDYKSLSCIADDKYYYLVGYEANNTYKKCKVIIDKNKTIK